MLNQRSANSTTKNLVWFECFPARHLVLKRNIETLVIQSTVLEGSAPMPEGDILQQQQENIMFADQESVGAVVYPTLQDPSYREDGDDLAALSTYLSRPVIVDAFTWNESDTFTTSPHTFYPWSAYFSNAYIKKKVENFARIHCDLKLTFRFNASPFYYGMLRACYDPLNTGRFDPVSTTDLVPLSQTPGVYLEPQNASTVELSLPFVWPNSWLDVTNNAEFRNMGKMFFEIFGVLRSANGVTGSGITITTYAQAENVQLAGPTTALAVQSGPISGPATAVAGLAGMASRIPAIAPFARAVQVGSTAVATIAKMFGYSNPPNTEDVKPLQNKVFHAFANVETKVPVDKLAVDPANEVTVDTKVAGCSGKDELAIQELATKKSYLMQTTWNGADASYTKLFSIAVTPTPAIDISQTSQFLTYHTPASFVGRFFKYWRGSMKYTFKIVRSQYHKGRLILSWDPAGNVATSGAETALFTKVYDLSEESDEIEFVVPYKFTSPWLENLFAGGSFAQRTDTFFAYKGQTNGVLTCSVQNILTGPAASPSVDILVFSQAGEDMEFSYPQEIQQQMTPFTVQSEPIDGSVQKYSEHIPEITVGERVMSLRPLLHRTSLSIRQLAGLINTSASLGPNVYQTTNMFPRLPLEWGFDVTNGVGQAQSVVAGTGNVVANYAITHPINFVLNAFVGYRGSTTVQVNTTTAGVTNSDIHNMSITRSGNTHIITSNGLLRNTSYTLVNGAFGMNSPSAEIRSYLANGETLIPSGQIGTTVTNGRTQMSLGANMPQYAKNRFYPAWSPYRNIVPTSLTRSNGDKRIETFRVDLTFAKESANTTTTWPILDVYYSAGVDFTPVWFVGVPRLYRYDMPSPA